MELMRFLGVKVVPRPDVVTVARTAQDVDVAGDIRRGFRVFFENFEQRYAVGPYEGTLMVSKKALEDADDVIHRREISDASVKIGHGTKIKGPDEVDETKRRKVKQQWDEPDSTDEPENIELDSGITIALRDLTNPKSRGIVMRKAPGAAFSSRAMIRIFSPTMEMVKVCFWDFLKEREPAFIETNG